ncbi:hypothetical protein JB92DRAFT_3303552 [Gautieria morchelliformis]|nr:hypothetical protein JB92DRAFT_3303552 [Gautieria morchelliformis]
MAAGAMAGLAYLDYMTNTWMPYSLWKGWSHKGHLEASCILKIPIEGVIPTTNHLEAFNAVLKRKYIHQWQRAGKRLLFDLFVYLLITQILPGIFTRHCLQRTYYSWLSTRFAAEAGGIDLVAARQATTPSEPQSIIPVAWWSLEGQEMLTPEALSIAGHSRIAEVRLVDPYTIRTSCASSLADIRVHAHRHYDIRLNMYGWAFCSCHYFTGNNGACKHLWAVRLSMPKLVSHTELYPAQYVFNFPVNEIEARKVYVCCFGSTSSTDTHPTGPPNSASLSQLDLSLIPNSQSTSTNTHLTGIPNSANDWLLSTMELTDNESEVEGSESEDDECSITNETVRIILLDVVAGIEHYGQQNTTNYEAIRHQIEDKIDQCAMCFHNCMAWSPFWTMQVFWLRHCHPMLTSLEVRLSRIMGKEKEIHPTLVPAVNLMSQPGHSSNVFGQASRALARPEKQTLLPPSPERKQRRKTSYAERNVSKKNRTKSMRYMIVNNDRVRTSMRFSLALYPAFCTPHDEMEVLPLLVRCLRSGGLEMRHPVPRHPPRRTPATPHPARLPIQTHISENTAGILLTASLFPAHASYAAVYDNFGLLGPTTILAHGCHLSDTELALVKKAGAGISHCFNLRSGIARVGEWIDEGVKVAASFPSSSDTKSPSEPIILNKTKNN